MTYTLFDVQLSLIQVVLGSVGVIVAAAVGFFLMLKIVKWIEHAEYNRDKGRMSSSEHYRKWHKYDVDGERDNW